MHIICDTLRYYTQTRHIYSDHVYFYLMSIDAVAAITCESSTQCVSQAERYSSHALTATSRS